MNCGLKHISTQRKLSGMTLVDMMVAVAIGGLVLTSIAMLSVYSARSFVAMGNYADLDQASRNALDNMSREIRQTQSLTSYTSTQLTFQESPSNTLIYVYDPQARTLTRRRGGLDTVLL